MRIIRKTWWTVIMYSTAIALGAAILFAVLRPQENGGFLVYTLWQSSFSRGGGIGLNNYSFEDEFPSLGIIFVRTDRKVANERLDRRMISAALRQLRWEFREAYNNGQIQRPDPSRGNTAKRPFPIRSIVVIITCDHDENSGRDYTVGVIIPAKDAFNERLSPESIVRSCKMHPNCAEQICSTDEKGGLHCQWRYDMAMPGSDENDADGAQK
jgi:hypothetical protein